MFDDIFEEFDKVEDDLKVETKEDWDTGYEENVWRSNKMEDVWKAE